MCAPLGLGHHAAARLDQAPRPPQPVSFLTSPQNRAKPVTCKNTEDGEELSATGQRHGQRHEVNTHASRLNIPGVSEQGWTIRFGRQPAADLSRECSSPTGTRIPPLRARMRESRRHPMGGPGSLFIPRAAAPPRSLSVDIQARRHTLGCVPTPVQFRSAHQRAGRSTPAIRQERDIAHACEWGVDPQHLRSSKNKRRDSHTEDA